MTKLGPLLFLDSFHQAASMCVSQNQERAPWLEINSGLQVESFLSCLPSTRAGVSSFLPQCRKHALAVSSGFACASKNALWRLEGQVSHCSICLDGTECPHGELGEKCCGLGQQSLWLI